MTEIDRRSLTDAHGMLMAMEQTAVEHRGEVPAWLTAARKACERELGVMESVHAD